jgi:hypothetical protein
MLGHLVHIHEHGERYHPPLLPQWMRRAFAFLFGRPR